MIQYTRVFCCTCTQNYQVAGQEHLKPIYCPFCGNLVAEPPTIKDLIDTTDNPLAGLVEALSRRVEAVEGLAEIVEALSRKVDEYTEALLHRPGRND